MPTTTHLVNYSLHLVQWNICAQQIIFKNRPSLFLQLVCIFYEKLMLQAFVEKPVNYLVNIYMNFQMNMQQG